MNARTIGFATAALLVAAGYAMLALWVLPSTLRIGYAVTATPPGVVVIGAAVAVALLSSVWIAVGEGYDSPRGAAEV